MSEPFPMLHPNTGTLFLLTSARWTPSLNSKLLTPKTYLFKLAFSLWPSCQPTAVSSYHKLIIKRLMFHYLCFFALLLCHLLSLSLSLCSFSPRSPSAVRSEVFPRHCRQGLVQGGTAFNCWVLIDVISFNYRMWSRPTLYVKCLETILLWFGAILIKLTWLDFITDLLF